MFQTGHPNTKHGGRPKGSTNRHTQALLEDLNRKVTADRTVTPLGFMLDILNSPKYSLKAKMWAAEKAAPFVHARKVEVSGGPVDKPVIVATREQLKHLTTDELELMMNVARKITQAAVQADDESALIDNESGAVIPARPRLHR